VPCLSSAVSAQPEIVVSVRLKTNKWSDQGICYLTNKQHNASQSWIKSEHQVKEDQQIREPHGSADVIQYMTRAIGQSQVKRQFPYYLRVIVRRAWARLHRDRSLPSINSWLLSRSATYASLLFAEGSLANGRERSGSRFLTTYVNY